MVYSTVASARVLQCLAVWCDSWYLHIQQLLASVSGTVHEAVSLSTYPCDPVLACVCAGYQSHHSSESAHFLPWLHSVVPR